MGKLYLEGKVMKVYETNRKLRNADYIVETKNSSVSVV